MKRSTTIAVLALLGALWMVLVLYMGWFSLAITTNYPGMFAARFVRFKGIAPSSMTVWMLHLNGSSWGCSCGECLGFAGRTCKCHYC